METIKTVLSWIAEHWDEVVTVVLSIIGALELIAKWTETDKDDQAVSKIKSIVQKVNKVVIEIISYITKLKGTK